MPFSNNNTQKDFIALSKTDTLQEELEIKQKNGKSKKYLLNTNPLKDDSNKIFAIAGFVSIKDVNKTNTSQQSDTHSNIHGIINHLPNFLIVTDLQLKINYWNTALEKRTGLSEKEIKYNLPIIFVGSKTDLMHLKEVSTKKAMNLALNKGADGFVECSSKTGENVSKIFNLLTKLILKNRDSRMS